MDTEKLRIFVFGSLEPTDTESYIVRALQRLGHHVTTLEENGVTQEKLIEAVAAADCDLFLAAKCRFTETQDAFDGQSGAKVAQAMAEIRNHVKQTAIWVFDALMPQFARERWQWAEAVAPSVNVFACTDGMAASKLPNGFWLPQGSPDDADDSAEWPTEFEGDALFVGIAYRERNALMGNLRARFGGRFRIVPDRHNGAKEIRGRELTALVRSYRICVCPPTPTWAGYWSNRAITLARHGGLLAMAPVEGMEADGWRASANYLATPTSPEAYAAKLSEVVERCDRGQLRSIQLAGYENAKRLSYDVRCEKLLAHLASKRPVVNDADDEPTELET